MGIDGFGYKKTDSVKIAEQIYQYNEEKKKLEIQLSEEMFRYRYISKRKGLMIHEVLFRLLLIIPITLFLMFTKGNLFLFTLHVFLIYFDFRLLWRELKLIYLLLISINAPFVLQFAEDHNLKTFGREQYMVTEAISMLQTQLEDLDYKIAELEEKSQAILAKMKQSEAGIWDKISVDTEAVAETKNSKKFTLKESSVGQENASQLYEYYVREEQYINNYLLRLQGNIQRCDKEIMEIEDSFQSARQQILILSIVFILLILIQSFFTGIWYAVTAILCFVGILGYIIYLEHVCKRPILLYLVERDSSLTREYAFLNSMTPIKNKRAEFLEEMEYYQRELKEMKQKRGEIVFS